MTDQFQRMVNAYWDHRYHSSHGSSCPSPDTGAKKSGSKNTAIRGKM